MREFFNSNKMKGKEKKCLKINFFSDSKDENVEKAKKNIPHRTAMMLLFPRFPRLENEFYENANMMITLGDHRNDF